MPALRCCMAALAGALRAAGAAGAAGLAGTAGFCGGAAGRAGAGGRAWAAGAAGFAGGATGRCAAGAAGRCAAGGTAGRAAAAGAAGLARGGFGGCGLATRPAAGDVAGGGGGGGACGPVGAGGLRRKASRRIRFVVCGVTNLAAPLESRNLESAMIIATPIRSLSGERAGRNAAERPSPIKWKWTVRSAASDSAEIASRIRLCSSGPSAPSSSHRTSPRSSCSEMDCNRLPESACFRASPIAALESPEAVTLGLACIREIFPGLSAQSRKSAKTSP